ALSDSQIETAIAQCLANARKLGPILAAPESAIAAMRARLGLAPDASAASLRRRIVAETLVPAADWPEIFRICPPETEKTRFEDKLARIDPHAPDPDQILGAYLTDKGKIRANFPKAAIKKHDPGLADRLAREA